MGEPVTEEMLRAAIERYGVRAIEYDTLTGYEVQSEINGARVEREKAADAIVAIFADALAELRLVKMRENQRRSFAYGNAALSNGAITRKCIDEAADKVDAIAAYAAGYARAERDVAEAAKKQATKKRERDWSGDEVAACALEDFADNIEQGAHRGAAKEGT